MGYAVKETSLGFTESKMPVGTHLCLIYSSEEERIDALLKFAVSGLQGNERVACFMEGVAEDVLRSHLEKNNISYQERKDAQAISLSGANEVYFKDGTFEPDRMLDLVKAFYKDSLSMGFDAARVIGDMTPEVEHVSGGERLMEYESRVTMLVRDHPVTSVCQYDSNAFDGATIMEVLKVHPAVLVNGAVVKNPFHIEPEVYMNSINGCG